MTESKKNQVFLDKEGLMSYNESEKLLHDISFAFGVMTKTDVNYGDVIDSLINAINMVRITGNYDNDIRIRIWGSISYSELQF